MNIKEVIEKRRSIRSFKDTEVKIEIINDILNCGRLSPSARNRQPWFFVVVEGNKKDEIANLMIEHTKLTYPDVINPTAKVIKEAPILILVFRKKDDITIIEDYLSIGACMENMCLRAVSLGLGSLWIRDIVNVSSEVSELVGHKDLELASALSLGYPNESPKARLRKPLQEIVEYYKEI